MANVVLQNGGKAEAGVHGLRYIMDAGERG